MAKYSADSSEFYESDYYTAFCSCGFTVNTTNVADGRAQFSNHKCYNRWSGFWLLFWALVTIVIVAAVMS